MAKTSEMRDAAQPGGFDQVGAIAKGRWHEILPALGIPAKHLKDEHGPCPGCGGKDRFRFDDKEGRGTWVCSQGRSGPPAAGDGFDLLQHAGKAGSKSEALRLVADHLGVGRQADDSTFTLGKGKKKPNAASESAAAKKAGKTRHVYKRVDGNIHLIVHRVETADGKTFWQQFSEDKKEKKPKGFKYIPYQLQAWAKNMPPAQFQALPRIFFWLLLKTSCARLAGGGREPRPTPRRSPIANETRGQDIHASDVTVTSVARTLRACHTGEGWERGHGRSVL